MNENNLKQFDIIIIGGGHAGCEAAWIASQFELSIAIITLKDVALASAPCNPAVGGVGKGQVVRELDAMGGFISMVADLSAIQYRTLNESKGYALQSTRVQIDKEIYSKTAEYIISKQKNIQIIREKLDSFDKKSDDLFVLKTDLNIYKAKKVIVTMGTFLSGKIHLGQLISLGGRFQKESSKGIKDLNFKIKKLAHKFKTGTPPRLDKKTIDFNKLIEQKSDVLVKNFHWNNLDDKIDNAENDNKRSLPQISCFLTHTNIAMMNLIRENITQSPVFNGQIEGVGPRYCPSIEDKASRYPDRNIHHVFIEPEGLNLNTYYPNGLSTSMPFDIQQQFINCMPGLENAKIIVPGYAVEYDVLDTTSLNSSLEVCDLSGLYFAGQINGTSGYEEAAAQGYVAGVNAALSLLNRKQLVFSRYDTYIGVLIEDLITKKRDEPYRLFAARSENRLYIREDNTILRMCPYRTTLGLNDKVDSYNRMFVEYYQLLEDIDKLNSNFSKDCSKKENPVKYVEDLLIKQQIKIDKNVIKTYAISRKYDGYISRLGHDLNKISKLSNKKVLWEKLCSSNNISFECKQRIKEVKPATFGQLKNINGIRPATLLYVSTIV